MILTRKTKSPARDQQPGGALVQESGVRLRGLFAGRLSEYGTAKEFPECFLAFLVRLHGGNGLKLERKNDVHENVTVGALVPVADIGNVRIGDPDPSPELRVCHPCHAPQYAFKLTLRQRKAGHGAS